MHQMTHVSGLMPLGAQRPSYPWNVSSTGTAAGFSHPSPPRLPAQSAFPLMPGTAPRPFGSPVANSLSPAFVAGGYDPLSGSRRFSAPGVPRPGMCPGAMNVPGSAMSMGRPPMGPRPTCKGTGKGKAPWATYLVGDEVLILSESHNCWVPGFILQVDNNGAVMVKYGDHQKLVPVQHQATHLKHAGPGGHGGPASYPGRCGSKQGQYGQDGMGMQDGMHGHGGVGVMPHRGMEGGMCGAERVGPGAALYGLGDEVMIHSSSHNRWMAGRVTKVDSRGAVMVKYEREQKLVPVEYQGTHLRPASPGGGGMGGRGHSHDGHQACRQQGSFVDNGARHRSNSWQPNGAGGGGYQEPPYQQDFSHTHVPPTDFSNVGVPPPTDFSHVNGHGMPQDFTQHGMPTDFSHTGQHSMPTDFSHMENYNHGGMEIPPTDYYGGGMGPDMGLPATNFNGRY